MRVDSAPILAMAAMLVAMLAAAGPSSAFTTDSPGIARRRRTAATTATALAAAASGGPGGGPGYNAQRRKELLSRNGPFFKLDRLSGSVEFGSSAKLVTRLDAEPNPEGVAEWLSDGRGLALSIWDEGLTKDLGNSVYRLQIMTLEFVTIQLSPRVDMKMWSQRTRDGSPVFSIQCVGFDPNVEVLPGVNIPASALGIQIDVSGQLRPTPDGTGVSGKVSFATRGSLPGPMRLLPDVALKAASDTINGQVVNFAVRSFESGAKAKYRQYKKEKQLRRQQKRETPNSEQQNAGDRKENAASGEKVTPR